MVGCFSFQFYIKPQPLLCHPSAFPSCFSFQFYIKPQQIIPRMFFDICCFSFQFYIKPQPVTTWPPAWSVVSHSNSTSNHNLYYVIPQHFQVVSHSNSTSNHNKSFLGCSLIFVVSHSNSTSNHNGLVGQSINYRLFLIPILHQTTTSRMAVIRILHVTYMTPMHKTSCRTPGKLVGCNFVFQRAVYQKNSSC